MDVSPQISWLVSFVTYGPKELHRLIPT